MEELKNVYQKANDIFRRWFRDNYFDLIVWYNDAKDIVGFQLCYDVQNYERAITFSDGKFSHNKIDQGNDPAKNRTPILVADGVFDESIVIPKFKEAGKAIDKDIYEYVLHKIEEYINKQKK
jgi:hypothetical protein